MYKTVLRFLYLFSVILLASCGKNPPELNRFHDDGRIKHKVEIVLINPGLEDAAYQKYAKTIVTDVRKHLLKNGEFYLDSNVKEVDFEPGVTLASENLKSIDKFRDSDFLILAELVLPDRRLGNYFGALEKKEELNSLMMRLKILDFRSNDQGQVVLLEIMNSDRLLFKGLGKKELGAGSAKSVEEIYTSMHKHFAKEVAARCSSVISVASSY